MFVVTNVSPRTWMIYAGLSLLVTLVIYFTVLKSTNDQIDQVNKSVNTQLDKAFETTGGATELERQAKKLADCVLAAGTDVQAAQACSTKFGG